MILVFLRHYLPGYEFGGPVRSVSNLADNLSDAFDFRIVTLDRDVSSLAPYPGVKVNEWNRVGPAFVYYISPESCSLRAQARLISDTPHDVIYLNSFFDRRFTLWPLIARQLGWIGDRPIVVAPRGEFSPGALELKRWKKTPFLYLARTVGLFRKVTWQASTDFEAEDIRQSFGSQAMRVVVARNLPQARGATASRTSTRRSGALRILFLSRITHKKNLDWALRTLSKVRSPVSFSVVGTPEHSEYWELCKRLMKALPAHVTARYLGPIHPVAVPAMMATHDLFFLPTRGENYGHVIAEALQAGTPVLISDMTPWRNLAAHGVGWDLPLLSEDAFAERIDHCATMPEAVYEEMRSCVAAFANNQVNNPTSVEENRRLFMDLIDESARSDEI